MESKNIQEPIIKLNNFRDESLKSFSPNKIYQAEIKSQKEKQFKTINNYSKEIIIPSKKKDMNILNEVKPKLIRGNLPSVFNLIEKRQSSYDKINNSDKKINNSNTNINIERKNGSPLVKINEYASYTEQKGFKNFIPKINNFFREKTLSPPIKQCKPAQDISKNSDIILISEVNTNENVEENDSKNKTNFTDFETKTLIRNKTIMTNFSTIGFGIINENNINNNYNDSASKFNVWNGGNNNLNNMNKINKNQIANLYQKQFYLVNNDNKKYDNIYIQNKNKTNNRQNKNQVINKIDININEKILFKRSPSETHEKNNYTIENMKEDILNYKYNKSKRINTHQNEKAETINNKYYSHDNKKLRKYIDNKKTIQINLNEGISYNVLNGYKYHFNISNVDIYLLKEINNIYIKKLKDQIKLWKKKYNEESIFMQILDIKLNVPEGYSTIVIEHPIGGENLTNFINSIGFYNENLLLKIISKLYKYIIFFQNDNYFKNILFCLCDIFLDVDGQIKIIPPLIRKISYLCNIVGVENEKCLCKYYFEKIKDMYEINRNCTSLFCLGFSIIQLITQNLIFKMKSFDKLINHKNNELKKCCLVHTLLTIEILFCSKQEDLLLSKFLELYPKPLIQFLHDCTDFNGKNSNQSYERLNQKKENTNSNEINLKIEVKELLKLVELPKNNYCKFEKFLENFEILYKNFNIIPDAFNYSLKKKKILSNLSRAFNIEKEEGIKTFLQIIKNNDEKYY